MFNGDVLHDVLIAHILCSVAVLVHNTSRNVFVFVRQFRPGKFFGVLFLHVSFILVLLLKVSLYSIVFFVFFTSVYFWCFLL